MPSAPWKNTNEYVEVNKLRRTGGIAKAATSCCYSDVEEGSTSKNESKASTRSESGRNSQEWQKDPQRIGETMHLDDIWTPAYYGDEEKFDKEGTKSGKTWILFSTKDGDLKLMKGLQGKSYPITGHYEVEIHGQVYKGNLLSELIKNVREKKSDTGEAEQRKCASLVYYRDLKRFAGSKKIEPFEKKEDAKTIGKGEFGEVTLRRYRQEANGKTSSVKVAVKRIKQTSRRALVGAMEVAVMCTLHMDSTCDKRHLLPLVGWYVEAEYLYVVTEFMSGGTLLDYLQSLQLRSEEDAEEREEKDHKQCLEFHRFVSEIATGMCVLEAKRIQHRDLAARNILLTRGHQIKIRGVAIEKKNEVYKNPGFMSAAE
ncbi:Tyrosine-protein kinase STK [Echinococcus granulosus]|uniref:Tyrosine-protein kinase STK n=1 Tax=Echinococcus granulosus TaxID=6210 RepID=W6U0D9_ECHGR|nr:Tyrosine-protein kinase STK [Echinococcus granulosus]EUB54463.1 Tyrosine-protein kinase STK [Echinococcus granulosus]